MSNFLGPNIIPLIEGNIGKFTDMEKIVAKYVLEKPQAVVNKNIVELSNEIFVSEATITRFCKKIGYRGFIEFKYELEKSLCFLDLSINEKVIIEEQKLDETVYALSQDYLEIIKKTTTLVDLENLKECKDLIIGSKKISIYGNGNSGIASQEMKLRFMRIGYNIESYSDSHIMKMDAALLDKNCVAIGISISGATKEVIDALKIAKENGAKIIAITGQFDSEIEKLANQTLHVASKQSLVMSNNISSLLPILLVIDILYAQIFNTEYTEKSEKISKTLKALGKI